MNILSNLIPLLLGGGVPKGRGGREQLAENKYFKRY